MTTPTRIYLVHRTDSTGGDRLVRATNAAQALRHVAAATLTVEVASQDELVRLVAAGVTFEDSGRRGGKDGS